MGGKAFSELLPKATFPRMSPAVYTSLKEALRSALQKLYPIIGTHIEAPGKLDQGDIDFLVCSSLADAPVAHEDVKRALGATHSIARAGPRTSHFAIPAGSVDKNDVFYQVDVHVCENEEEWRRIMFYHSFGDLGMMVRTVCRVHGLSFGTHGLKLAPSGDQKAYFLLSSDTQSVLSFLGLSYDVWQAGFEKESEVFDWVSTSNLFIPQSPYWTSLLAEPNSDERRTRRDRAMYARFITWVRDLRLAQSAASPSSAPLTTREVVTERAITFFGKREEHAELVRVERRRRRLRENFSGHLVAEWTGLPQGLRIKELMDAVRAQRSEDEIADMNTASVHELVLRVYEAWR